MNMYRADVLRLLPEQLDVNGNPTGRRLVNDTDLMETGFPLHTVTLPKGSVGEEAPRSGGASLLVVYRDTTQPLTKIVVFEGAYVQPKGVAMRQTIRGFLQSSTNPVAKTTHIIGSGGPSTTDRLWFTGGGGRCSRPGLEELGSRGQEVRGPCLCGTFARPETGGCCGRREGAGEQSGR